MLTFKLTAKTALGLGVTTIQSVAKMVQLIKSIETISEFLIARLSLAYIYLYEIFMSVSGWDFAEQIRMGGLTTR